MNGPFSLDQLQQALCAEVINAADVKVSGVRRIPASYRRVICFWQ
ncbi:hypothetical protein [Aliamphritea spongicola]|nr:hypothetical protein [Aliamphritea spongicola]